MSEYQPHNWVILHINHTEELYKVLAGWSGGYLDGDSWRMSSGIVSVDFDGEYYSFYGDSGSVYKCHKDTYGLKMNNAGIYEKLKEACGDDVILMPEDTDWTQVDWLISYIDI